MRWSFTRSSNCKALTGKILVFWISGRLCEVVAYERWSHMEFWLYFKWNVIKVAGNAGKDITALSSSGVPLMPCVRENTRGTSQRNELVHESSALRPFMLCRRGSDIHTSGKETTLMNSIFFVLGLSEVGRVWGIKALFDGVFLQLRSVAAECCSEDCFGDDWVSWKQVSEWINQSWFESSVERLNLKVRVS